MFATSSYEEIIAREKKSDTRQIVVFLFVRPVGALNQDVIKEFEYIHYNSGEYCSIYAIGYTDNEDHDSSYSEVNTVCNNPWYYSNKDYVYFKNMLERRINWRYSGEVEILILQNNPGSNNSLNFKNYVSLNLSKGIREGYVDSFQSFMEALIRSTRFRVESEEVARDIANGRLKIKDIIGDAVGECKKIPAPVNKIIRDRLFYKSANNYRRV